MGKEDVKFGVTGDGAPAVLIGGELYKIIMAYDDDKNQLKKEKKMVGFTTTATVNFDPNKLNPQKALNEAIQNISKVRQNDGTQLTLTEIANDAASNFKDIVTRETYKESTLPSAGDKFASLVPGNLPQFNTANVGADAALNPNGLNVGGKGSGFEKA